MITQIVVADDHKIICDGLQSLIEKQADMEVVGQADNGRSTIRLVRKHKPDVVIIDITMPELNGFDTTRQILAEFPKINIIALSMHFEKHFIVEMLLAGAKGYLLKECAFREIIKAIRSVISGKVYLSSRIAEIVTHDYLDRLIDSSSQTLDKLSMREHEVLQLMAEGKNTKEIACCLNVSTKTVEAHRKKTMEKLNIYSIAGLTKYAIREGITSVDI